MQLMDFPAHVRAFGRRVLTHDTVTDEGVPCRLERMSLVLQDGSIWRLDAHIPHGEQSLTSHQASHELAIEQSLPNHFRCWQLIRHAQTSSAVPA